MRFGGGPAALAPQSLEQQAAALREQLALIEEQLKQKA
jgi:hypothetical protein